MPKRKAVKKTAEKNKPQKSYSNLFSKLKFGESYTSLFLGALVVIIVAFIGFSFMKTNKGDNGKQVSSTNTTSTDKPGEGNLNLPEKYIVKEGDDLWSISESIYKSGYNWVDIAKVNNLPNPGVIYVGMQLDIPDVAPIVPEISPETITTQAEGAILGETYTVVEGDNLWNIAVRAYGDGYKFPDIAKVNNIANPDLIYSGNVLKLPQ
ncbi:MAG: LysM peptidoglycan-binding domain-containing protein [Candidatus Levyibacteriota bacterium]